MFSKKMKKFLSILFSATSLCSFISCNSVRAESKRTEKGDLSTAKNKREWGGVKLVKPILKNSKAFCQNIKIK